MSEHKSGPIPKYSPIPDSTLQALVEMVDHHRRINGNRRLPWYRSEFGKLFIGLLASALTALGVAQVRIAVLESRVGGVESLLAEMRQDIKTLLLRVR